MIRILSVTSYVMSGESFAGLINHAALDGLHVISELAMGAIASTIGIELE